MSEINTLKKTMVTGTLLLTISGILSRIIGFFYRIFLSRTFGAEGLGLYQLVFPIMAIGYSFTAAGIQTAISRFVSRETASGNPGIGRRYLTTGLLFSIVLSIFYSLFIWQYGNFIARAWLGDQRCTVLLKVLSLSFLPSCIHACVNGYYYGKKKTLIPSFGQLLEQTIRVGSVFLLYQVQISQGKPVTISLAVWGIVLGECASMLFSLSMIGVQKSEGSYIKCGKNLISMALPLSANRIVLNLFSSFENIMIPNRLKVFGYTTQEALSVYGVLTGMAIAIIMFPSVLTNSFSVLLLPAISEAQAKKDYVLIEKTIKKTIRLCLGLGFLCTLGFLLTGRWIGTAIFENSLAGTFIITLGWICPFLYLGTTLNSILHGLGHPEITFILNLLACGIRILAVLLFIPVYGIRAYLWGMLISQCIASLIALFLLSPKVIRRFHSFSHQ